MFVSLLLSKLVIRSASLGLSLATLFACRYVYLLVPSLGRWRKPDEIPVLRTTLDDKVSFFARVVEVHCFG